MRVVFTIQGEGRGHLSQAIALREQLEARGHTLVGVLVGQSRLRPLPAYFLERMAPLTPRTFPSPTTVPGRDRTGVSIRATVAYTLRNLPSFLAARHTLRGAVAEWRPDLIVNFYDALAGMALGGGGTPFVSLGHQYLLGHPDAPRPPFRPLQLIPFRLLNWLTAPRGSWKLALSFRELADRPGAKVLVVPPLLRQRVLEAPVEAGPHLVVYVLNDGYGDRIRRWQALHPEVQIQGFWDRAGAPPVEEIQPGLRFHTLSDVGFLEALRASRGFVGTAGFESVAEALWLDKPVMVVPTGNQVEQAWNAREAEVAGAGISAEDFDLSPFLAYLPGHRPVGEAYRAWVQAGTARILDTLEAVAARRAPTPKCVTPARSTAPRGSASASRESEPPGRHR
jgi:uncharacterized protein (TIGR00661 family)